MEPISGLVIVLSASAADFILGLFTYSKNPKSITNKLFFLFTCSLASYLIINHLALVQSSDTQTLFWIKMVMSIALVINLTFFLLAINFPYTQNVVGKKQLWFSIIFTLITIPFTLTGYVFSSVIPGTTQPVPGPAMPLFILNTVVLLGGGIVSLINKYRHTIGRVKTQIGFLLVGTALMFLAILITNLFLVIVFNTTEYVNLLPIYTTVFTATIAYAIIRHRFLDIGALVARAVTYSLLTLIIAFMYTITLFAIPNLISVQHQTVLTVVIGLILVFTFNPLRRLVEKATNDVFYKQPYSSESLLETLGEIIRSTLTLETLGKNTLEELTKTIHITRGALVITQKDTKPEIVQVGYKSKPDISENTLHNLTTTAKNHLVVFEDLEESSAKMLLRQHNLAVVIPLKVKSTSHGLLLLGEKSSGEIYSQQDLDVLEIVMPQLSVAVQNAKSYEEIKGFADTLKEEVDKATADLRKANRELRHLDKLKDEFVFIATHELKNPVTAMRGYLSMLQEGSFGQIPEKMKDPFSQLQYSNQQLVDLVNDLLQIARAEAKTLTITTTKVELCPIVEQVIESVKALADQKHLTIKHDCPKGGHTVMADESRLKEIMNNLVSNAIKYSDQGTVVITHQVKDKQVITNVKDEGVGIAQKDKDKIFTRFFRVEEEAAKGIPGTGLGLFIVKQLIEKMGGKIWFDSEYGHGTTFHFSLPQA